MVTENVAIGREGFNSPSFFTPSPSPCPYVHRPLYLPIYRKCLRSPVWPLKSHVTLCAYLPISLSISYNASRMRLKASLSRVLFFPEYFTVLLCFVSLRGCFVQCSSIHIRARTRAHTRAPPPHRAVPPYVPPSLFR